MLINLTPHPIHLRAMDGQETIIPSTGLARVAQRPGSRLEGFWTYHLGGPVDGPVPGPCAVHGRSTYGAIEGLPSEVPKGTHLIVSLIVAMAALQEIHSLEEEIRWAAADPAQWGSIDAETQAAEQAARQQRIDVLRTLLIPGTGPADEPVRDADGRVIAVTRLVQAT